MNTILSIWQIKRKNQLQKNHLLLVRNQNKKKLMKRKKLPLLMKHPKKALQFYHLKSQQQAAVAVEVKENQ